LVASPLSTHSLAAPQDPFAPGMRWIHQAPNTQAFVPSEVAFAHGGERVFAAGLQGHPRLLAFPTAGSGLATPWGTDDSFLTGATLRASAQPARSAELWALVETQGGFGAELEARSYPVPQGPLSQFVPTRTWSLGPELGGPAKIALDGAGRSVVTAVADTQGNVTLRWLGSSSGQIIVERTLNLGGLSRLEMQADGARVLVGGGTNLYLLDSVTGATVHYEALAQSGEALALAGNGSSLAIGEFGRVRLLGADRATGGYLPAWQVQGGLTEVALLVELDRRGTTMAIAWWDWTVEDALRFELWDLASQTRTAVHHVPTAFGTISPQNRPSAIAFSRDGKRAVFSSWGDGSRPQVVLLESGAPAPIATWSVPGSPLDVDLSPEGTRVAVALKSVHANAFGTTGEVRLYDTGERDLVQLAPAAAGNSYSVATRKSCPT
ncbi:MAG: hypothetical protein AAF368_09475, partial [Planctomycetota bacterium]